MAYLTSQTEQGNGRLLKIEDGVFFCEPEIPERVVRAGNTNTWHLWHMKAVGEKGERVKIKLLWPLYDPALVSDDLKKMKNFELEWESFVTAARDVVFMSCDRLHWTRVEDAALEGNVISFEADLPAEETYFTVTLYYTPHSYRALLQATKDSVFVKQRLLGQDAGGDDLFAFEVTDFSVPEEEKTHIYLQGAQHCSEFYGAYLCDGMIRFLSTDNAARGLLKTYAFHFVPVVSLTSLRKGLDVHESGVNPNRDWVEMTLPTTRAVHSYLEEMPKKPALLLDVHCGLANYGSWEICQALSVNDACPAAEFAEMKRFVDAVYENCDFLPTRRYWQGFVSDAMFDGYGERYGQTHTMEISLYAMYDRAAGRHYPTDQARLERFAAQLAHAIDVFFTDKGE